MTPEDEAYFIKVLNKLNCIEKSLEEIQKKIGLNYIPLTTNLHSLTSDNISSIWIGEGKEPDFIDAPIGNEKEKKNVIWIGGKPDKNMWNWLCPTCRRRPPGSCTVRRDDGESECAYCRQWLGWEVEKKEEAGGGYNCL